MLVTIHLRLASQQHLVVALTTLSTIEIHMVSYKYIPAVSMHTYKRVTQVEYISCNMGTCDLPEIYALTLGLRPRARAYISGKSLMPMLQLLHSAIT